MKYLPSHSFSSANLKKKIKSFSILTIQTKNKKDTPTALLEVECPCQRHLR